MDEAFGLGGRALNQSRCQLVGQGRSGKTATGRAFSGQDFIETESTIGVSLSMLEVEKVNLNVDHGGEWTTITDGSHVMSAEDAVARCAVELFQGKQSLDVKESLDAAAMAPIEVASMVEMLAPSVNDSEAQREVSHQVKHERDAQKQELKSKEPTVIKKAAARVPVDKEAVIRKMNMALEGTPLKARQESLRLSLWDCAGQENFYMLLHLYLFRYCIYPLLFNMEWVLPGAPEREECLKFLTFWLGAISMHAVDPKDGSIAPILLIGTHKDKVPHPEQHEAISKLLDDKFQAHPAWSTVQRNKEGTVKTGRGILWFFPVDNTRGGEDPSIQAAKRCVLECVGKEKYVKAKVPYAWLSVFEVLQKESKSCMELDKVLKICADCGMQGTVAKGLEEEMLMMLKYFTEMGLLMHHRDAMLRHLVILNPAEAVIAPASIVLCSHDIHENEVLLDARTRMPDLYELLRRGILDRDILAILWKDYVDVQKELEFLMTKYQLIVPILSEEGGGYRFLVPALLPTPDDATRTRILANDSPFRLVGHFIFGSFKNIEALRKNGYVAVDEAMRKFFLPKGLFTAVLGKVVEECQRVYDMSVSDMELTVSSIKSSFNRHVFELSELPNQNMIQLVIMVESPLLIVERMLALIQLAVSKMMPNLHFALCVDQGGGVCQDGHVTGPKDHLVIIEGVGGLENRLTSSPPRDIPVAPGKRLSQVEARKVFGQWLPPLGLLSFYHVFLSYRWGDFDTDFVKTMFASLYTTIISGGRQVQVFLDRNRLEDGRDFSTDFATALINSLGAVPIVSYASLMRMLKLEADSNIDNVLLEWRLILELLDSGHLHFCMPIMIGTVKQDADDGNFISNLFVDGVIDKLPQVVCTKVSDRVKELLLTNGKTPSQSLYTDTVRDVVSKITRLLGVPGWDVNDTSGASSSHGGASQMHVQARWKQKLVAFAVDKTMTCIERVADKAPEEVSAPAAPAVASQDTITIADWLKSISLQQYADAIIEYGYDSLAALDAASQEEIKEMSEDKDVAMKKPHSRLLLTKWRMRAASKGATTHAEGDTSVEGSRQEKELIRREEGKRVKMGVEEAARRLDAEEAMRKKAEESEAGRKRAEEELCRVKKEAEEAARRETPRHVDSKTASACCSM